MKKNENLDSKLQILTPNQEIFKNSGKFSCFHVFFIFFIFFHFPCPWHLKSRKAMKNNEKPSKTKENEKNNEVANEKKWSCKWKKMKIWTQSCRFSLRTRKSSKTRGNFHFFSCFSFFFHFPCPWHLKSRKAMKNNGKQWKTIKNKGKWKKNEVANEKKWKFGLKVADSHSEPGNLQKLGEIFMFSCFFHFFHFFSFSLPVAPEIQESHEKQWKTIKNKGKWKNNEVANEKKWSCKWKKWNLMAKGDEQKWKNEDKMKKTIMKMIMKMKMKMKKMKK